MTVFDFATLIFVAPDLPCHMEHTITMTEEQIERKLARLIDNLDAAFMSGKFTQAEYDAIIKSYYADYERALDLRVRS